MQNALFTSYQIGPLALPNRFVMAPMTRGRAGAEGIPNGWMAEYYTQRASAGLLITEATSISPQGRGWVGAPGIYTDAQVNGWRSVTDAVHKAGGRIFVQLWHMGRVSHPDFQNGELPVAPSAIAANGEAHTPLGKKPYVTPRALETREIKQIVSDYAAAARRAREAGFDGVELHAANGYLVDQFLRDGSNQRTDEYGGSIPNRARFLLEVTEALTEAWAPDRVGVRLSPTGAYNDMRDSTPAETFSYAAKELGRFGLAFLHVFEGLPGHWAASPGEPVAPLLRQAFSGPFILNGGYTAELGGRAVDEGMADLIAFGVPFLANPDFVKRVEVAAPLNQPDMATFYTAGREGYLDYPLLESASAQRSS